MTEEVVVLNVYKSRVNSIKYLFKDGTEAAFVNGVYRTQDPAKIAELDTELANNRHPILYIDSAEKTVQSDMVDPMAVLRQRIIDEYLASQAAAIDPTRDMGSTEETKLNPASTADIASASAGGDGSASASALSSLASRLSKVTVDSSTGTTSK